MAFDLSYILVPCDHRIVDDVVEYAIDYGKILIEDSPIYNNDVYFGDAYFGNALYIPKNNMYQGGKLEFNTDGTITAKLPIRYRVAHSPRLFFKKPWEYRRTEVKQEEYYEWATKIRYGRGHRFGVDVSKYDAPSPVKSVTPQKRWYINTVYDAYNNYVYNELILKRYDPTFTWIMDYNVDISECPYCFGKGVENDIHFNKVGKLEIVLNTKKLVQQVMKSILTPKSKNFYFPKYGTNIKYLLGTKNIFLGFLIRSEIMDQLLTIKKYHDIVITASKDLYGPYETLNDLLGVEIYPGSDPRSINLKAILQTNAFEAVNTQLMTIKF